jgi:hypothetical protein
MMRALVLSALAVASFSAVGCDKLDAVFENERASTVLSILATQAGLTLVNPEFATSRINATFEGDNPGKLLPVIAWDLGFELRVQGKNARLHQVPPLAQEAGEIEGAGL